MENKVTILGARGSVPVSGESFRRYGGATTCILVELEGETLLIDAGNGILSIPKNVLELPRLSLLLTHAHVDHLLGLPMCPYLFKPDGELTIYAAAHEGRSAEAQVRTLLAPPLWPVGIEMLPCRVKYGELTDGLRIGGLLIETLEGVHPGGVTLLRISGGGKRIVVATDCTVTHEQLPALTAFAGDCDLLLCDGQYSDGEWPYRSTFGHSRWTAAAGLAAEAGAVSARIIHHDPAHTDGFLDAAAEELRSIHPKCSFAWEGEVIQL